MLQKWNLFKTMCLDEAGLVAALSEGVVCSALNSIEIRLL